MHLFPGLETPESRSQTIVALERQQTTDPTDLIIAHDLGLAYYWEALQTDDSQRRVALLESVMPLWAMVMESDDYWKQWCAERRQVYGVPLAETEAQKAREALAERFQRLLANTSPDLEATFFLETKAVRLLRQADGLPLPRGEKRAFRCGPLMVKRLELEAAVGEFFGQWFSETDESSELLEVFHHLFSKNSAVPKSGVTDYKNQRKLMQCFSQLAYPAVYVDRGRPEQALQVLSQNQCAECAGYSPASPATELPAIPRTCASDCPTFVRRNPAYARLPERGRVLWRHAVELTAEAYMGLAEQCVRAVPVKATDAVQHWQSALAVASVESDPARWREAIAETALNRAAALEQSSRLDDAVLLLDAAQTLSDSQKLSGKLAELLTDRGIKAGNARQWENAVADLRRALPLSPRVRRARSNLVIALQGCAQHYQEAHNSIQARVMLEEAVRVLEAGLQNEPQDEEWQKQLLETRGLLSLVGGAAEAAVDPFDLLREILNQPSRSPQTRQDAVTVETQWPPVGLPEKPVPTLPQDLRQRVAAQVKRKEYAEAVADLEQALRQAPEDGALTRLLVDALEEYADDLLGKRQFDQAAVLVEKGLKYAPDHEGLKATQAAIRLFKPSG